MSNQKPKNSNESIDTAHPRARNSISRVLIGMAMMGYTYDPTKRSPVPKEIADDLVKLGIPVGDDTVRKILNEAADDVGHLIKREIK